MAALIYVGTSGWQYRDWAADFYADTAPREWLKRYAERFHAVEVNGTFYRQVKPEILTRWRRETPAQFRFSLKVHRYLTHVKRLQFEPEALERQRSAAACLEEKLAVMLWQLPPSLGYDLARLEGFLALLRGWPEVRHALEFRHRSWFRHETAAALGRDGHAVCLSDAAAWPLWNRVVTDLVYVRLHGHQETYRSNYDPAALRQWAHQIKRWHEEQRVVHVYFDNTDRGAAWRNALFLKDLLAGQLGPECLV